MPVKGTLHFTSKEEQETPWGFKESRDELKRQSPSFYNEDGVKTGHTRDDYGIHGDASPRFGLTSQLERPGQPTGSNLHSLPPSRSEESLTNLHGEDILAEQRIGSLTRKDGFNKDSVRIGLTRKDFRSDYSRGLCVSGLWIRNKKRQIECRIDIGRLNAPFLAIYKSLIPAEEERGKQKQLLTLLENLVNKEWPNAHLYLLGSWANSFGISNSDVDFSLAIGDTNISKSEIFLKSADILQAYNLENVQDLTRARVPIVKLMDPVTGISCDIWINNVLAVVNTKLL
ncbi:hypothetical protein NE237_030432 [Protea cynaroides]|uniref:Poly(A) RNA polymerase mitochondrial-like central palm domain-containing protein n=1 Tax=Protea cynaroides TaxID=273540 RepID=A0A9Q0JWY6_9MAGN|nr:hypothetical protein NE237_030432 [Protea cynaroides]